jgi:glyoxylase-like metal-dependent hydrolase (beta-lactamase superfamily II)
MVSDIEVITTPLFLNVSINCYLVNTDGGFVLIDTGRTGQRRVIEQALENAGCQPGNLKLIILTHGDFDHCGNAAYLRKKFAAKIAMHYADLGMVERGDMLWNRNRPNPLVSALIRLLVRLNVSDRFTPDLYLKEGDDLSVYGFDARVVALPGHSKGSIGLLTTSGDLFCGDLLANTDRPALWTIIDDAAAAKASVEKLERLSITMVYPGHGEPFPMTLFRAAVPHPLPSIRRNDHAKQNS